MTYQGEQRAGDKRDALNEELIVAIRLLAWKIDGWLLGELPDLAEEEWDLIADLTEWFETKGKAMALRKVANRG